MNQGRGSIVAGMAICWLLNIAQLGVGWLLLVADVRMLPAYYVLVGAIGLVQIGYVLPIWRLLRAKRKAQNCQRPVAGGGTYSSSEYHDCLADLYSAAIKRGLSGWLQSAHM